MPTDDPEAADVPDREESEVHPRDPDAGEVMIGPIGAIVGRVRDAAVKGRRNRS